MIKSIITSFRSLPDVKTDAELQAALKVVASRLLVQQQKLDAAARETLVPVKHTLSVVAVQ